MIIRILLFLLVLHGVAYGNQELSVSDLLGMRKNYDDWRVGLPAGDVNTDLIGNGAATERMVYSESVSYCLFSHVIRIPGENEAEQKEHFMDCWNWAKNNMVRKGILHLFVWNTDPNKWAADRGWHTVSTIPQEQLEFLFPKDDLMAWRYIRYIPPAKPEEVLQEGIIYAAKNESDGKWHDGSQVATDGDLLTAYSLYLAYKRGWGNELLADAQNIVAALRQKTVFKYEAGEIYNAANVKNRFNMFWGHFNDLLYEDPDTKTKYNDSGSFSWLDNEVGAQSWKGKYNYLGLFHNGLLDLLDNTDNDNLDRIEIVMKGILGKGAKVDVRLEDNDNGGIEGNPGHVWKSNPIGLTDQFETFTLRRGDFAPDPDWGNSSNGRALDWGKIKNVQFQVQKNKWYDLYKGTYNYNGSGAIKILDISIGNIDWTGNKNFVGFNLKDVLDLSDLKEIRISIAGTSSVELRLKDDRADSDSCDGNFTTGDFALPSVRTLTKSDFVSPSYCPNNSRPLNWANVRKLQIQVNEVDPSKEIILQALDIKLNNGQVYSFNMVDESSVYVKSINVVLKNNQTHVNDGYKLVSNAHGAIFMNPSYFMPFAYRAFAEIDHEGEKIWDALLDDTYKELNNSLEITLHDPFNLTPSGESEVVVGNNMLIPNWYMFDILTGERTDVEIQKAQNGEFSVKGYDSGYDAFRTLWYIALDYYLNGEPRAKTFLEKVYPFYRDEWDTIRQQPDGMGNPKWVYPVYKINGKPDLDNDYPAGSGFEAVYANLFGISGDQYRKSQVMTTLTTWKNPPNPDGRVWFTLCNPSNSSCINEIKNSKYENGKTEYFMNFWSFFGLYSLLVDIAPITPSVRMPVPIGQQVLSYPPVYAPVNDSEPNMARPIGIGGAVNGGETLSIQISFEQFSGPVDIYLGISIPEIDSKNVYLVKPDNSLQTLSQGLIAWKQNISSLAPTTLFGNIPVSSLPGAKYFLYVLATPAGQLDKYYLWQTNFEIGH